MVDVVNVSATTMYHVTFSREYDGKLHTWRTVDLHASIANASEIESLAAAISMFESGGFEAVVSTSGKDKGTQLPQVKDTD